MQRAVDRLVERPSLGKTSCAMRFGLDISWFGAIAKIILKVMQFPKKHIESHI